MWETFLMFILFPALKRSSRPTEDQTPVCHPPPSSCNTTFSTFLSQAGEEEEAAAAAHRNPQTDSLCSP